MERLVHRRVQRAVDQFFAGGDMGLADQTNTHGLVHHGIQQQNVVGFERDDRLEPGLLEQLFGQQADTVAAALEHEGGVFQVFQADAFLPGQRVGHRQRDQQLLMGHRQIRDLGAGHTGTQGQVDAAAGNGGGLLHGIKLGQGQGDARKPPRELVVDLTINNSAAVGGGSQADAVAVAAGHIFHGQQHPVLFVLDLLGAVDDVAAHGGGVKPPVVAQEQRKAKGALALGQELAQCRGRDVQRLGGMGQVAIAGNGGNVMILFGVHGTAPFGTLRRLENKIKKILSLRQRIVTDLK